VDYGSVEQRDWSVIWTQQEANLCASQDDAFTATVNEIGNYATVCRPRRLKNLAAAQFIVNDVVNTFTVFEMWHQYL
jgi:plastocyanin